MFLSPYISDNILAVDVGSNVGEMSEIYAKHFEKVISIDANKTLCKEYKLHKSNNVKVINKAVGEINKKVSLEYFGYNIGMFRVQSGNNIDMITIDSLNINPSFVKIDVEGYEINVLKGAVNTIKQSRPLIYIEYQKEQYSHYGFSANDLWNFCKDNNYLISGDYNYLVPFSDIENLNKYLEKTNLSNLYLISRSFYDKKNNL